MGFLSLFSVAPRPWRRHRDYYGYSYANNNPVMLVDPDGHWAWALIGGAIGGVTSYKAARAKGARGWKLFGATAGGAALGAVGGGGLKLLKSGYRVVKVGKLKGHTDKKGYWGIKYSKPKLNSKKRVTRSFEVHTPHNNHGWHLQKE